jgi:hypothetical protein
VSKRQKRENKETAMKQQIAAQQAQAASANAKDDK